MKPSLLVLTLILLWPAAAAAQSNDLAARSQAAARAMKESRFDEAARIYQDLVRAQPNDAGLHMNLGMALAMGGREPDAIEPLERALALQPDLFPARLFLGSSYLAMGQPEKAIAPLKRVVAARPAAIDHRQLLAQAYSEAGRPIEAVTELRTITELAPKLPAGWFALGHAYNAVTQEAIATFEDRAEDAPWRQLLLADALFADGRFTDAFANYRAALEQLPAMVTIHDSIAGIYAKTGHADWAAVERQRGVLPPAACVKRKALCEFRAGRHRAALVATLRQSDPESRYWRARSATELALAAFKRLDALPDSRERRETRAILAREQRRYVDAIAELKAALTFAPGDPDLIDDLGTAYFAAREYEQALATLKPLLQANPDDPRLLTLHGDALLQLQRTDEAVAMLQRAAQHTKDPMPRLSLGRALVQKGDFAAAIPLIEPQLAMDEDGSVHVQLARAYTGIGQREKAAALLQRSEELRRAAQQRSAETAERRITPPK